MRLVRLVCRPLLLAAFGQAAMRRFLVSSKPSIPAPVVTAATAVAASSSVVKDSLPVVAHVVDTHTKTAPAVASNPIATSMAIPAIAADAPFCEQMKAVVLSSELAKHVSWQPGEPVPYSAVVGTLEEISQKSGRLDKENILARLFRCVLATTPADLEPVTYITFNQVHPVYDGLELGVGDSLLVKAICEATGRKKDAVEEDYEREGDLGIVALASRSSQTTLSFVAKPKPLTTSQVLEQFRAITLIKGDKAQARKVAAIKSLLIRCQGQEAKYIVRALQGKLRIGLAEQTVLVSLSHAFLDTQQALQQPSIFHQPEDESGSDSEAESNASLNNSSGDAGGLSDTDDEKPKRRGRGKKSAAAAAPTPVESGEIQVPVLPPTEESASDLPLEKLLERVVEHETPEARALRLHLQGLSRMPKEKAYDHAEVAVKRAFSECPNLSLLLNALNEAPLYQLYQKCKLRIGVPVAPMLAKPTKQVGEVLTRLQGMAFTMEYKYDGERAQVHLLEDGSVKIFSRNSEDNTEKYPDLKDVVRNSRTEGVTSCIVDAEVVAYDREKGCLLPFQVLSTRKRKVDSPEEDQKVKVILQLFDLIYLNGRSLLRESLRTRRTLLHKAFTHNEALLHFAGGADHVEDGDTAPIEAFLMEACNAMCEGLMVKTLDEKASYEPSKRSLNWLKLKKDYINGMGVCDSVDLVPIGGYLGKGKRVNTYGAYLMACYDPDRDEFQSVCKVGTGFKDEDLEKLSAKLRECALIPSKKMPLNYNVSETLYPDDWFEAGSVVWELQAADLSRSSVHRGGVGRIEGAQANGGPRGIGLRFPRYLRERDDKKAEQATTSEQIVDMFYSQTSVEAPKEDDDEGDDGI